MRHAFFLIVCTVMLSTVFGCPTSVCLCSGSTYRCARGGITTVPSGIPNTTTALFLNENQITEIKVDAFQGMAALEELYLYINRITNLVPNVFQDLTALKILNLNGNQITEIKVDAFQGMAALEELFLFSNRITNLVPNVFQNLTALKRLSLWNNQITEFNVDIFQGMTALKELTLGNNQITEINVDIFQGLAALERLDLSGNPLNCGNCEMSQLKVFLQNQTYGNAGAVCNGTGIKVVDFDFTDCTATETNTLNTTKSNVGSTSEADNIAIITGTVTGAVVVLCVIAFFVMRKVCNYASNGKTVVHPSI